MSVPNAKQAMEQVAVKYGVTYEEVYQEIEAAIAEAMEKKRCGIWGEISCQGDVPTPIELIEFIKDCCVM